MEQQSLFDDIPRSTKANDLLIATTANSKPSKAPTTVKSSGLLGRLDIIRKFVEEHLGKYRDEYITIQDEETLYRYIEECNKVISVDTETTGLDPLTDKIIGISLYSPYCKGAYIPLRHRSVLTGQLLQHQLPAKVVADILKPVADFDEDRMFNAKFDTRFIKHDLGLTLHCTWDAFIAAREMNENEASKGLKPLHSKYVLNGTEDEFSFGTIFKNFPFDLVPIDIATIYAAHDAVITWELADFQMEYLYYDPDQPFSARNGMNGVSWNFFNIEMPCIEAIASMEDNGILLDKQYAQSLSVEYSAKRDEVVAKFHNELQKYADIINRYRLTHPNCKLDNPISISSPTQLATLFYDILGFESVDKKSPRGTGEAILQKFDDPIAKIVLEYRGIDKLLGTYIDKIPREYVNPDDGRVHANFKQYGADTGRMSSDKPNLQNIPHDKTRKMFIASPGYVLMSSDYSQQEPSCLAAFCHQMGYDKLYNVRLNGGDIYSATASACYKRPYEDCVEFRADGTKNTEGKKYRNLAKPVILGILYSRGDKSVAEGMCISIDEARQLKYNLFKDYPEIMIFEQESLKMGRELGYVTTVCGRKRRLPDLMLDEYEFEWVDKSQHTDVLSFGEYEVEEVPDELCNKYWRKLKQARFNQKRKIFEEANKRDGIWIIDNGEKIAESTRQCVNARIQGSAADLTKLAIIDLYNSKELRELGFRLLIPVHDEIIAECPEENAQECSRLLAEIMSKAAEKILNMPFKCDVEITREWYGTPIDGSELKKREAQTSHATDAELRGMNGN